MFELSNEIQNFLEGWNVSLQVPLSNYLREFTPLYIHYKLITKEENEGNKCIHLLFLMTDNIGRESFLA